MDYIKIGDLTFTRSAAAKDNRVESANIFKEKALNSDGLAFDTMEAELSTKSQHKELQAIPANTPVLVYRGEVLYGRYYSQTVERTGPDRYRISAQSPMSVLTTMPHAGGVYTGQTVKEVVEDICGAVPVFIKSSFAKIALYGWLPYVKPPDSSARDNLAQVLFAIGASLGTDLNGVLRVESLWDGISSTIIGDRLYEGGSINYDSKKVTAVTVTEHQYVQGSESKELFSGTTQAGDIITFDEPMHSLSATGFTILESGANYAKVAAGSGTLTGKAYIHTTRQVTETVADGAENIKTIKDATLVSLVNSLAVAKRLADYYRCTETIKAPVVAGAERPGHVVSIYHPYDKIKVPACIESTDITMSAKLKSDLMARVGFKPPQLDDTEYYDERVVLTGSGTWEPPEGIETIRYTLGGAAAGGKCGRRGGNGSVEAVSYTGYIFEDLVEHGNGYGYGPGGKGGEGGEGGEGGKILQGSMAITPGMVLSFKCGVGGKGASYSDDAPDAPGSLGTDTILEGVSSADGTVSPRGYTDPITGEVFGGSGETGIPGGDGGGKRDGISADDASEYRKIMLPSDVTDEDGNVWLGGATKIDSQGKIHAEGDVRTFDGAFNNGWGRAATSASPGSGAAAGSNGHDGSSVAGNFSVIKYAGGYISAVAHALDGTNGASATLVPHKAKLGRGGRGGYGGGGGGSIGYALTGRGDTGGDVRLYPQTASPGTGGIGSDGGEGGDGFIIIYYRKSMSNPGRGPVRTRGSKVIIDRFGRRFIV